MMRVIDWFPMPTRQLGAKSLNMCFHSVITTFRTIMVSPQVYEAEDSNLNNGLGDMKQSGHTHTHPLCILFVNSFCRKSIHYDCMHHERVTVDHLANSLILHFANKLQCTFLVRLRIEKDTIQLNLQEKPQRHHAHIPYP